MRRRGAALARGARRWAGRRIHADARKHLRHLRELGPVGFARFNGMRFDAWTRAKLAGRTYRSLDEPQLTAGRTSDTVFIFGSGHSLNDLSDAEWEHFRSHDTMGLNWFVRQRWIRVGYHYIREAGNPNDRFSRRSWLDLVAGFAEALDGNPLFDDTVLFIQDDFIGLVGNMLTGYRLLRPERRIFRYHSYQGRDLPTHSFRQGIPRTDGAIGGAVNLACLMGWTQIVLVGVDLYDTRYFWLPAGESREGRPVDEPHPAAGRGIVERMGLWRRDLDARGVHLSVYNPKSLLSGTLPVYEGGPRARPAVPASTAGGPPE